MRTSQCREPSRTATRLASRRCCLPAPALRRGSSEAARPERSRRATGSPSPLTSPITCSRSPTRLPASRRTTARRAPSVTSASTSPSSSDSRRTGCSAPTWGGAASGSICTPESIQNPNNLWNAGGQNDDGGLATAVSPKDNVWLNAAWQFNLNGLYQGPWGLTLGANLYGRQGYPRPYRVVVVTGDVANSDWSLLIDDVDTYRYPNVYQLDLRLQKALRIGPVTSRPPSSSSTSPTRTRSSTAIRSRAATTQYGSVRSQHRLRRDHRGAEPAHRAPGHPGQLLGTQSRRSVRVVPGVEVRNTIVSGPTRISSPSDRACRRSIFFPFRVRPVLAVEVFERGLSAA